MPDWKSEIRRRLVGLQLSPTRESAIVEELSQYLNDCYDELVAGGATEAQAYRQTLTELQGSELLAHELRRAERRITQEPIVLGTNRRTNMIADLWQDLRFGVRMLRKNRSFTLLAALTLALGIGANTAIFSVVNGVLLRPLPFPEPERLVTVWERYAALNIEQNDPAAANYADWKAESQSFDSLSMFTWVKGVNLTGGDEPARILSSSVTANLFQTLRVGPLLGRVFTSDEEPLGRDQVALLSYSLWKSRFGGDPAVIGKTIALDAQNCVVVGVMPPGFVFPGGTGINPAVDLWRPLALSAREWRDRSWHDYQVTGRLKPGVSLDQARIEMDALQTRIQKANPSSSAGTHCKLIALEEQSVGTVRRALLVLFGAAAFVLLIACANVANLSLARAAARQREFAIRAALGAGRWPIIRQSLVESVLLALIGAGLGAQRRDVLKLIVVNGMTLAALGVVIGMAGALAARKLIASLLYGISATDPLTFAGVALLLAAIALLACWIPARRATKVDPMIALRCD